MLYAFQHNTSIAIASKEHCSLLWDYNACHNEVDCQKIDDYVVRYCSDPWTSYSGVCQDMMKLATIQNAKDGLNRKTIKNDDGDRDFHCGMVFRAINKSRDL